MVPNAKEPPTTPGCAALTTDVHILENLIFQTRLDQANRFTQIQEFQFKNQSLLLDVLSKLNRLPDTVNPWESSGRYIPRRNRRGRTNRWSTFHERPYKRRDDNRNPDSLRDETFTPRQPMLSNFTPTLVYDYNHQSSTCEPLNKHVTKTTARARLTSIVHHKYQLVELWVPNYSKPRC